MTVDCHCGQWSWSRGNFGTAVLLEIPPDTNDQVCARLDGAIRFRWSFLSKAFSKKQLRTRQPDTRPTATSSTTWGT